MCDVAPTTDGQGVEAGLVCRPCQQFKIIRRKPWFVGTTMLYLWSIRSEKKKATKIQILAELEANLNVIEKTDMVNAKVLLRVYIN